MKQSATRCSAVALLAMLFGAASVQAAPQQDIVDTAVSAGSFKTLATALQAADLVEALKGKGPFTVFAPTDAAFEKLPKEVLQSLLKPENKAQLAGILTYHVASGSVPAKQVVKLSGVKTLNGQRVDIAVKDGKVYADKASVVKTDIECSNGVIHVIDQVILPASDNLAATAEKAGAFKTLLAAAEAAGLVDALSGEKPLTVFAPTDEAFAKLPKETVASLLKPENREKLAAILTYHVIEGRVYSEDALKAKQAKTLQGQAVQISVAKDGARVNDAKLIKTDLDASNGVIHVIDAVLLPPEKKPVRAADARQMIEHAVSRGARLFNTGHHSACAALYMTTMQQMVDRGSEMPPEVLADMRQVMTTAEHCSCATQQSWTLRHGLDRVYAQMASLD